VELLFLSSQNGAVPDQGPAFGVRAITSGRSLAGHGPHWAIPSNGSAVSGAAMRHCRADAVLEGPLAGDDCIAPSLSLERMSVSGLNTDMACIIHIHTQVHAYLVVSLTLATCCVGSRCCPMRSRAAIDRAAESFFDALCNSDCVRSSTSFGSAL